MWNEISRALANNPNANLKNLASPRFSLLWHAFQDIFYGMLYAIAKPLTIL